MAYAIVKAKTAFKRFPNLFIKANEHYNGRSMN